MTTRSGTSGEPSATYHLDGLLKLWLATKSNAHRLADNEVMKLDVECYSGRKADERPVRFRLKETQYAVEAVLDQWYDPESIYFKVCADHGNIYILRQQTSAPDGMWDLVSFRGQESTQR
jgi:hypothetical protein